MKKKPVKQKITITTSQPAPIGPMNTSRVTEPDGPEKRPVGPGPAPSVREIGRIPLPDYIRMVHPGAVLIGRRSLHWMLFVLFVGGLFCGLILGRMLA